MSNVNPFSIWKTEEIEDTMSKMPIIYGDFRQMGIFKPKFLYTHNVLIEEREGRLKVSEARPFGSPGQGIEDESRALRTLKVPHFPHDTHVSPAEVRNLRAFGRNDPEYVADVLNDHLRRHRQKFDVTIEYMMAGAIQGLTRDGVGNTLLNSFTEYGVAQTTVSIDATNDAAKLKKVFRDIRRAQSDALKGVDTTNGASLPCGRDLFDAIIDHPVVQKHYLNTQFAPGWLKADVRKQGFEIEGVRIWEYDAESTVTSAGGVESTELHLPKNEGIAFPLGTMDSFVEYIAPSDFNEDMRGRGKPYYVRVEPGKMNRGYDIHSQFNRIPMCKNPKSLIKVTL